MKTKTITTITIVIIFIAVCIITIGCTAAFTYKNPMYVNIRRHDMRNIYHTYQEVICDYTPTPHDVLSKDWYKVIE